MIPKSAVYILLAVSLLLFLPKLGMPLLDPDEGLYAEIAREMVTRGDWVIPHVNGLPYLEKPPLYFWLTASTFWLFGLSEWATRLWSAISALGTVLLTWRIGRRLYGAQAGLLAGVVVATVVGNALYVRRASTDQLFVFCLTLAIYGFLRDAERPDRGRSRFLPVYVGAGLSVLAKGFIGLVFPVLIIGLGVLAARGLGTRRQMPLSWPDLNLPRGLAVFLAITVPWHALVAWRSPGLFNFYVVDNHLLRFLNARRYVEDDVPSSTVAFLVASFLWAFPWSVFVLARRASGSSRRGSDAERPAQDPAGREPDSSRYARWRPVIVIWLVVIVGLFAASRFKHEYYALPAFPALAVLVGAAWAGGRDIGRWLVIGLVGCGAVGVWALWIGSALTPGQALTGLAELNAYYRILRDQGAAFPFPSARPFGELLQWLGVVLIAGWGLATLCWFRAWRRGAFVALVGVAGVITVLIFRLLDVVEPNHSVKETARALVAQAGPADVLVVEGTLEYSPALPFYTGRQFSMVNGALNYFSIAASLPEADGLFLTTAELVRLWNGPRRVFLVVRRPRGQSVVAALPAARVHELGRYGSRWLYSNRASSIIHVDIHRESTELSTEISARHRSPLGRSRNNRVSQM
jgi:4-amino-4-deoxy-L-arabinose transferase-like glycosyltransferase